MNKKYFIGSDASTYRLDTKHGNIPVSTSTFNVYDCDQGRRVYEQSYVLIDESTDYAEAFAIHMALQWFTNSSNLEPREAILFSDSNVAVGETHHNLANFIRAKLKYVYKMKSIRGFKGLCYMNAVLLFNSIFYAALLYQPGHPDRMNYNLKEISKKADHENAKLGLKINKETFNIPPYYPMYVNQVADTLAHTDLMSRLGGIKSLINSLDYLPSKKERQFPLYLYSNQIQITEPMGFRPDVVERFAYRPEVVASPANTTIRVPKQNEGVILNGDTL